MIHDIFMPALSSTMTEGKIVSWVKSPGEKVSKGETVVVVESDKADMDVESFHDGYLAVILVEAGNTAPVGSAIALIAQTEAEISTVQSTAPVAPVAPPAPTPTTEPVTPVATVSPVTAPPRQNGRLVASPRAKKLAKDLGIDLTTLQGSGPHGRIVAADLTKTTAPVTPSPVVATPQPAPKVETPDLAPKEVKPLTTLQRAVVQNMLLSLEVPTFHVGYTITTDALDQLYQQLKSKGVTMTALLAKAVALTLQKHPLLNSRYTEQGIQNSSSINVAIAVAMPDGGLITPVLQSADTVDLYSLSRNWKSLVERSRAKQLQPEEYNSGNFTISNLGMFGVDRFDAILPPGQSGILAIGASRPQVVATEEGMIALRRQMAVNLTCDHRVVYGAHAATFLQDLAALIETNSQSLTL
jgi:pyruvate dehydrogenase E2 component (dihydrolipoamide acetyltransferase)